MTLAIPDTAVTPVDIKKLQSGDPLEFQKLYRKYYDKLVDEATHLFNNEDQAMFVLRLSCMKSWIHCEDITSETYYFGYIRSQVLRYAQVLNHNEYRLDHDLGILNEILSDRYEIGLQELTNLYDHLTLLQKELVRQTFKSFYQPVPGSQHSQETGPHVLPLQTLLNYAFYTLHYILAGTD